jgi:predicted unusual protein kinase regulating ubiquinone biosynthesis (AarF/ABC1/UbiB family)
MVCRYFFVMMHLGYIHDHLRQEVDFLNEGKNSEKAFKFIQEDGFLRENIYVPKVCLLYSVIGLLGKNVKEDFDGRMDRWNKIF